MEIQNRLQQFLRKSEPNPTQPTQNLKKAHPIQLMDGPGPRYINSRFILLTYLTFSPNYLYMHDSEKYPLEVLATVLSHMYIYIYII